MKAIIFVRVSRKDQDYQRQLQDLRAVAATMGISVVKEITEKISGATRNLEREGIQELLMLAHLGKIDKVLVQEVSRLGRSTVEVLQVVEELTDLGVSIYVQNFGIETLKKGRSGSPGDGKLLRNPVAQFLLTMLAEFARLERETLRERILSGMEEARRKGKKIGRPEGSQKGARDYLQDYPSVVRNLKKGLSLRQTAKVSGVAVNTVRKVKSVMEQQ